MRTETGGTLQYGESEMTNNSPPDLEVLYNLDLIVRELKQVSVASMTVLKNKLNLTRDAIGLSLGYGVDNGYLFQYAGNTYKIKRDFVIAEEQFYPAVKLGLEKSWRDDKFSEADFYIEQTARRDSKIVGPWTRPDFTLVSCKKFAWTIGSEFDVVTFEVKRPDSCNVLAVFEALSHASAATRAYVVFPIDAETWARESPDQESRVKDECSKHGVGLILVSSIYTNPTPHHVIRARKREIDHEKCSNFLDAVISQSGKAQISKWK